MKLLIARLNHETNTFSPVPTPLQAFNPSYGHDAVYVARLAPAAMIFVPCAGGISHNEIEDAEPEHLEAGCNVLLRAMLASAGVAA